MGNAIDLSALLNNLPEFFEQPSACYAVALPLVLGVVFNLTTPHRKWPEFHAVLFVLGTALSVLFSVHRVLAEEECILGLPGYTLLLLLLPLRFAPSWQQAYVCSFGSVLLSDVWGSAAPHLMQGSLPSDFYFGIGGAGFEDQLFLIPGATAVAVGVRNWLCARSWASRPLGDLLARGLQRVTRGRMP